MTTGLGAKLVAVHASLDGADIPHAVGGAIALAYCTSEPRATIDLDINVFVPPERARDVLDALPERVQVTQTSVRRASRDGQVRVWWEQVPIDLFFAYHPFHDAAARRLRLVPFEGVKLPVLDCTDLVVFKALYGRTRDWADIEAAAATGSVDRVRAAEALADLSGANDPRLRRLSEAFEAADGGR